MTRILFFGRLRDIAGHGELACQLPTNVATVADLRAWLREHDPLLGDAVAPRWIRVVVNKVCCISDADSVRDAEEIAFMPPLSGG